MRKQRILHVVGAMNRGGAETMLMSMYRNLDKDKVQFDFLEFLPGESDYAAEIREMGGRVFRCTWSKSPFDLRRTINNLSQIISNEGPFAAVHSHVLFASGIVLAAAAKTEVRVRVAHSHNTSTQDRGIVETAYQRASRAAINAFATHFAACTTEAGNYLFGERKFSEAGTVIPNAVDTDQFRPTTPDERNELRSKFGLSADRLVLASVARMEPVKNHRFLISLAAQLEEAAIEFDLLFVGDGSLRSELESEVASRGLESRVHFWGLRTDISDILRCVDALLMPSHFEGLPVALVEAQATGVRCLVSENISNDADMGLELMDFLPVDDESLWVNVLISGNPAYPSSFQVKEALLNKGYSVEGALEKCLTLYSFDA